MNILRPEIDLRQLRAFAAVAEELHFGRAAERLGTAQPALSVVIRRLEEIVGCALLDRDTRKVTLTEAGRALHRTARTALGEVAVGLDRARQVGRGEAGLLAIGFTATTALEVLPVIVRRFVAERPGVELSLTESLTEPLYEALWAEHLDLGLVREAVPDQRLNLFTVMTEPFVVALPSDHALAADKSAVSLADFADETFVLFSREHSTFHHDMSGDLLREAGIRPRLTQQVLSWQTAISLVAAGVGVTVLPRCVSLLHQPGVAYRPVRSTLASRVMLVWRKIERRPVTLDLIALARHQPGMARGSDTRAGQDGG